MFYIFIIYIFIKILYYLLFIHLLELPNQQQEMDSIATSNNANSHM